MIVDGMSKSLLTYNVWGSNLFFLYYVFLGWMRRKIMNLYMIEETKAAEV